MKNPLSFHILLHIIVFVWGFTGILGKLIEADQYILVWWRTLIAFICMGLFLVLARKPMIPTRKQLLAYFGVGLVIAAHWVFFYGAIKISNVSVAVSCMAVASFFTALLQPFFTRTKIIGYELLLGIGVVIGVGVLMGVETTYIMGFLWGVLSAFFAALFTVFNARLVKTGDSTMISFYEMVGGFISISIFMFFTGDLNIENLTLVRDDVYWILLLSVFCTAIPFVLSVWIMRKIEPYTISISVNMEPIYTFLLALMIWPEDEKMSAGFYIGAAIILSTVLINILLKSRLKA
jgi:drug/metabolite transporter (DMT)-like permease